jgi:hypothetical protein
MVGACSMHGVKTNSYRIFMGKLEEMIPLGTPKRRWEDNVKIDRRAIGLICMGWLDLAQNRDRWSALVNTVRVT